ncbi:PREDICTED: probable RNA-binding protein 19 [Ceratosolen solmsi marchali]|uniref:Probable RNA-binding protein 19 n=1 Tax=Ceratosolen solmsi marchali TaxID=326594 RepID=A0AAJ7DY72_9HYME|nr:PREDICTED: probable RNA-binding protein 19 [Ceratosolen solmsi marchali]
MSRLIVKNLPKNVTEKRLKQLFSEKGLVTDLQLKYTEDGKFRRFAFVGFKSKDQADEALRFFNNSCIDTSRITLEYCSGLGDASKPKSWSKYAQDSNAHMKNNQVAENLAEDEKAKKKSKNVKTRDDEKKIDGTKKSSMDGFVTNEKKNKSKNKDVKDNEIKEIFKKHTDDPMFREFMECRMKGDSNVWQNDVLLPLCENEVTSNVADSDANESELTDNENSNTMPIANKDITDKEYMEALKKKSNVEKSVNIEKTKRNYGPHKFFTVKIQGLAYNHKKKDIKQFFKGFKAKSIRVPSKIKGIAYVGFETEKQMKMALNKNKSFLDGKRLCVSKYERIEDVKKDVTKSSNLRWKQQEETLKSEESVAESGRIFLRNLTYTMNETDIKNLFEKYGPLTEVNLPIDKITRKPKGFGTVTFMMPEHAVKAYTELDGTVQDGRMLHLLPAKSKTTPQDLLLQDGLSYKQRKQLQDKVNAGSSHNWNTLFLGHNAVADAIATTYNTTKENVLQDSSNGTSMAVRLALGETQLVLETQKFLEDNGVYLNAFNQPPNKRSKTVILVKNLPVGTHIKEIRELFSVYGELGRLVLPPTGVTALVEFVEPSEARKAFTKLAYSKFKHLPLYLEWAPDDSFTSAQAKRSIDEASKENKETNNTEDDKSKEELIADDSKESEKDNNKDDDKNEEEDEDEDEPEPDTTLFIKNLNFTTTDEQLQKYFSKCGPLHYANISMKKDPNNPGKKLSMGYGFVRYKLKVDAERALKELQMRSLDGKSLELKRSERTLQTDVKTTRKSTKITEQTGTKILIRNIPFQANADEVKDLFKAFGELKAMRLPKKMVGDEKHRGFGFAEFYTKKDAKRAFKALCQSTHLYGRRLVLEWAQKHEDIEELRKRTAKHFHEEQTSERSKKATLDPESVGLEVV